MRTAIAGFALMLFVGCAPNPGPDGTGQVPADVARSFIAAVQAGDYDEAASYFTKRSVNAIQHNSAHGYSFQHYCAHFRELESYEFESQRGKAGYCHELMSGRRNGNDVRYLFSFEKVGGKWLLAESENSYFWDQAVPGETSARLQIMTYRLESDRVDFPLGAGPDDTTVLVHRIGHDRAIPSHPMMAEPDGSFHVWIELGSYPIEHEVIVGKRDSQQIT